MNCVDSKPKEPSLRAVLQNTRFASDRTPRRQRRRPERPEEVRRLAYGSSPRGCPVFRPTEGSCRQAENEAAFPNEIRGSCGTLDKAD